MTRKRRTYTDEFKREALRLWESSGKSTNAIEQELGMSSGLLNKWKMKAQARTDIFFYIEAFYNRQRRHSTLGYVSPEVYEAAYYQCQHHLALTECPS